jgi:hypothetical protein
MSRLNRKAHVIDCSRGADEIDEVDGDGDEVLALVRCATHRRWEWHCRLTEKQLVGGRDQWNQRLLEARSAPDVLERLW